MIETRIDVEDKNLIRSESIIFDPEEEITISVSDKEDEDPLKLTFGFLDNEFDFSQNEIDDESKIEDLEKGFKVNFPLIEAGTSVSAKDLPLGGTEKDEVLLVGFDLECINEDTYLLKFSLYKTPEGEEIEDYNNG